MYKKTVLDSGITVVTEAHRYQRSVAVGVFVETGTRDETQKTMGTSHFVEHMVFKGTKRRSASDIARAIEAVGGDLNAFTTREYTCFHALSLKDDLALDIDVLGDLVCNAQFTERDFEREKNVILQEVAMTEDTPEEYIYDLFFEKIYGKSSLGWPILGTKETLENLTRGQLLKYYRERYAGRNLIVAAAGALEHDEVVEKVEKSFKNRKRIIKKVSRQKPKWQRVREVVEKDGEQTHIVVGFEGVSFVNPNRFDAFVLNAWLGGGMSSRLYQSIREKKGLAYTVYSNLTTFVDCGTLTVYAGTEAKSVKTVLDAIERDVKDLKRKKLKPHALQIFKQQVKGNILLGADDMENRMSSLGVNEMTFGEYMPVESIVEGIDKVTASGVKDLAQKIFNLDQMAILVMGDIKSSEVEKFIK
ncbi:MAG: pitrilysin family protein [Oligoflexia bacterium]|nr:pitrilysin family protein [Oligoflexia bacterium]